MKRYSKRIEESCLEIIKELKGSTKNTSASRYFSEEQLKEINNKVVFDRVCRKNQVKEDIIRTILTCK